MSIFLADQLGDAPNDDYVEVTVFGPGYGESIVIHIPGLGWGIVDSCRYTFKDTNYILPLEYLKAYDVQNLSFVILTHPHADHFRGMEDILRYFGTRIKKICFYSGDGVRELFAYLVGMELLSASRQSDLLELANLFKFRNTLIKAGVKLQNLSEMTDIIPSQDVTLKGERIVKVRMLSLSPSACSVTEYANLLRRILMAAIERDDIKQLLDCDDEHHNLIASALLLQVGDAKIILGSDVEIGNSNQTGWKGICSNTDCPELSTHLLKVSHHGSVGAHYDQAWITHNSHNLLTAIVTLYNRKTPNLPSDKDITRIKNHSAKVGITSTTVPKRADKVYEREISRLIQADTRRSWLISQGESRPGLIRVRLDTSGNIVELKAIPPAYLIHN